METSKKTIEQIELLLSQLKAQLGVAETPVSPTRDDWTLKRRSFRDWLDVNGFSRDEVIRLLFFRVAQLDSEGLSLEQILRHRNVRRKRVGKSAIPAFLKAWKNRANVVHGWEAKKGGAS